MRNQIKILLTSAVAYSAFGHIAAIFSSTFERKLNILGSWVREAAADLAFEVDRNTCEQLNRKAKPGVTYYPLALGRTEEDRPFYETSHPN